MKLCGDIMSNVPTAVEAENWDPKTMPVLKMVNITKRFPGVLANDHINLEVMAGEIHALLGENGAGKTTLMNILYGLYRPNEGEIYVRGQKVEINSPKDALDLGIGMVHQHFKLVDVMSVAENVALGLPEYKFVLPMKEIKKRFLEIAEKYKLQVDPDAKIWQLSAGEKQRVEILKVLLRGAEILILDEPTSVLTPQETVELFKTLKTMTKEGLSVIFITHKLEEVMEISDNVTVLRRGRVIDTVETKNVTKEKLAKMMVGREVLFRLEKRPVKKGAPVIEVQNLEAFNDKGVKALRGVSFVINEGEILGIAGVAGNGQRELAEVITGLRKATGGRVLIFGEDVTNRGAHVVLEKGLAHIPEERIEMGIIPGMSVKDNMILHCYKRSPFSVHLFDAIPQLSKSLTSLKDKTKWLDNFVLNYNYIKKYAENLVDEYQIMTPSIETNAEKLSGGNIQKLILARELAHEPKIIIAAHPTYGLDVGATEFVRKQLLKERERGAAILLISEDLEEIFNLSDRIAVMFEGEIMGIVEPEKTTIEEVGLMMAGSKRM